jgi:hypothetical protein
MITEQRSGTIVSRLSVMGIILCATSLLAFAALQYAAPGPLPSRWSDNFAGVEHFQKSLTRGASYPIGRTAHLDWFLITLLGAWEGYALVLVAGMLGAAPSGRWALPTITALSLLLAVGCPASLSYDIYAYVAFARMPLLYGLNPLVTTPKDLVPLGDATVPIVGLCEMPSVYGPLWTLLCAAEVAILLRAGLWWQVVGLKLFEAVALVVAAIAGKAVAEHHYPGRGDLALLAIGLNPLLLIEGPANGHSDLVMMALVLSSAALYLRGRLFGGDLMLGLSIGVKFLPLALLPWLILERCRGKNWRHATRLSVCAVVLALAPTVLAYVPLWRGSETFTAIQKRTQWGAGSQTFRVEESLRQRAPVGLPGPMIWAGGFAVRQYPVVLTFLVLSAWLWRSRTPGYWLDAWGILAFGFVTWTMTARYPWYMIWPLTTSLTRWGWKRACLSAGYIGYGIYMMQYYTHRY